jgi:hypothetical protein
LDGDSGSEVAKDCDDEAEFERQEKQPPAAVKGASKRKHRAHKDSSSHGEEKRCFFTA